MNFSVLFRPLILATVAIGLVACATIPPPRSANCYVEGGSSGVREAECRVTWSMKSGAATPLDLSQFNASSVYLDFSSSISTPKTGTYSANIVLTNNGNIVAARTFMLNVSGFTGVVVQPAEITAWVRSYNGLVDEFDVTVSSRFLENAGSNSVTFELVYGTVPVSGWSHAWYAGSNGGGGGSNQMN